MARPRVLLLASSADLYGADKVLLDIAEALEEGYEVVVALPAQGPLVAELERRGVSVVVLDDYAMRKRNLRPAAMLGWILRVSRTVRLLSKMQRELGFAVVYSNTLAVPLGPLLRFRFGLPHIWHAHEVLEGAAWFRRSLGLALRYGSDAVVCVSRSVEDQLCSIEPSLARKSIVVYNAVDVPVKTNDGAGIRRPRVSLGCVGRIYPRKGHLLLLEALALARSAGADCDLLIFGDPLPNMTFLEEVLAAIEVLGLGDAVQLLGFEARPEKIYSQLDVLILASTEPEALPLACLEAQAWSLPVIAPDEGGPAEIVVNGETGILTRPRDAGSLAKAIETLVSRPDERRRMGEAGRRRVTEHFSRGEFRRNVNSVVSGQLRSVA